MHPDLRVWTASMQRAADGLAIIVKLEAASWASDLGFSYVPSVMAPGTFEAAKAEFKVARAAPRGFYRVSKEHSAKTIFRDAETNYALRFWHDMLHVDLGADFSLSGERRVAREHLRVLTECYSVPRASLLWRLMRIDSLGQNECVHAIGRFPSDQRRFVAIALRQGLTMAIDLEQKFGERDPPSDRSGVDPDPTTV